MQLRIEFFKYKSLENVLVSMSLCNIQIIIITQISILTGNYNKKKPNVNLTYKPKRTFIVKYQNDILGMYVRLNVISHNQEGHHRLLK